MFDRNIYCFTFTSIHLQVCLKAKNKDSWANIFELLSAVQIYDFHIFLAVYLSLHGFIWNQHNDQLPVGLLAQLVEHCTGIAEVTGSNPVQA